MNEVFDDPPLRSAKRPGYALVTVDCLLSWFKEVQGILAESGLMVGKRYHLLSGIPTFIQKVR